MTKPDGESLIAVVVGNSSIGVGVFDHVDRSQVPKPRSALSTDSRRPDFQALSNLLPAGAGTWRVASVCVEAAERLRQWVKTHRPYDTFLRLRYDDFPIRIDVEFAEQVGADRLAGVVAANALRRADRPAIVVDAGTAITVNAISADGRFLGGAIIPGRTMASAALCANTDLLPTVEIDNHAAPPAIGTSTAEAIRSGLYWGTVGAVHRLIEEMRKALGPPVDLFLTGGGMVDLAEDMSADAKFVPDLVLRGVAMTALDRQTGQVSPDS